MVRPLAPLLCLALAGCVRGSGVPWELVEIELEAGSRVKIEGEASATFGGGRFEAEFIGPAHVECRRDGTVLKDGVPVKP